MIICDTSNIDIIQGIIGYGNISEGMTDWRIENTNSGIFNILNSSSTLITPSGGTSEIGEISGSTDRYMIFTAGTSTFTVPSGGINCDILIVGGGGGGGFDGSGGGGGGEVKYYTNNITTFKTGEAYTLSVGTYTINIGSGGAAGANINSPGSNGTISEIKNNLGTTLLSASGGGGGGSKLTNGVSGVGGGGGAGMGGSYTGGSSIGSGGIGGLSYSGSGGGGGGGANVANKNGGNGQSTGGGSGGVGVDINITGISRGFGGGGGGGTWQPLTQVIGTQGGGNGGTERANPSIGISNTGGGGGGGGNATYTSGTSGVGSGGSGGSGIVIIRYRTANISIIDNGNVGIGITPVTNSSLLEVAGDVNIIGNYKRNNRDIILDTSNYVLSTSNILTNYYNSNKPIGGNGINISETLPPVISSTQWTMSGNNIYSTTAISIGTVVNYSKLTLSNGSVGTTGITCRPLKICAGANTNAGNETATFIGLGTGGGIVKCGIGHCRTNFYDRGSIVFACNNVGSGVEFTMADEAMRITSNGRVGIGLTNPEANIHVAAGTGVQSGFATYFNFGYATFGSGSSGNTSVAVKVTGSVWATDSVLSTSDIRIKNDIQDIIDDSALQIILAIEPKTYKYIDKIDRFDKRVYGFIAQQIRDVIPDAVNIQLSYIPNIMLLANYNNNIITFSSQPNYVIKYNDKIKCYDKNNKEIFVVVEEIINVLTFRIKELDNVYTDTNIFVYGCEVEDFHTLDKTYIYTLNVCATQEINRRIEAQNAIIQSQEESIKELETMVSLLLNNNST
jgi:hypothetical protein